jgi:pyruvate dehydrogenase E1 component alpha subunit
LIKEQKICYQEEIAAIDQRVKDLVQECVTSAEESDYPPKCNNY